MFGKMKSTFKKKYSLSLLLYMEFKVFCFELVIIITFIHTVSKDTCN